MQRLLKQVDPVSHDNLVETLVGSLLTPDKIAGKVKLVCGYGANTNDQAIRLLYRRHPLSVSMSAAAGDAVQAYTAGIMPYLSQGKVSVGLLA